MMRLKDFYKEKINEYLKNLNKQEKIYIYDKLCLKNHFVYIIKNKRNSFITCEYRIFSKFIIKNHISKIIFRNTVLFTLYCLL